MAQQCGCDIHEGSAADTIEGLADIVERSITEYARRTGDYDGAARMTCLARRARALLDRGEVAGA